MPDFEKTLEILQTLSKALSEAGVEPVYMEEDDISSSEDT